MVDQNQEIMARYTNSKQGTLGSPNIFNNIRDMITNNNKNCKWISGIVHQRGMHIFIALYNQGPMGHN